jgi:transcriptional regulator GlxA family with amidase domain
VPDLYEVALVSLEGGLVSNRHGLRVHTEKIPEKNTDNILLLPGGWGVRAYIDKPVFLEALKTLATESRYVLSVCNGSALLGKAGLLTGRKATTNKGAFHWVTAQCPEVWWQKKARWVVDGKFYTSSGVSAGMDMTLGFLRDQHGLALAEEIAHEIEYRWQQDKDKDDFEIA